jgi:hypothetical protein
MDFVIIGAGLTGLCCALVCGEYQSLSSIHWAMVSGRRAAAAVIRELQR